MAETALVGIDIDVEGGAALIKQLRRAGFPVAAALWLYRPESSSWRLVIASPMVEALGPRPSYRLIQEQLQLLGLPHLSLMNISAIPDSDPLAQAIKRRIQGQVEPIVRIHDESIGHTSIEHAYVYNLARLE